MTKTQRLLDLIIFLAGRRVPVPVDRIMESVPGYAQPWTDGDETAKDSVRRTFERDKDELKALGLPIHARRRRRPDGVELDEVEGYVLARADLYLPYLRVIVQDHAVAGRDGAQSAGDGRPRWKKIPQLPEILIEEHEAAAALDGLRRVAALPGSPLARDARSAFRKIAFDLDPSQLPGAPVVFGEAPPSEADVQPHLTLLSDAICRRKRVRFGYRGVKGDSATQRDLAPYLLFFRMGAWYVVGHDALRNGLRTFRVSRMDDLSVNTRSPHTSDFEPPVDVDLRALARREPWEVGPNGRRPSPVRVLFPHPASLQVERSGLGEPVSDEPRSDGAIVRSFGVVDREAFLRWILTFEGAAEVQSPAEWRREAKDLAGRIANLHAPDEAGDG